MTEQDKTLRDLDPRDIKVSTIGKLVRGLWKITLVLGGIFIGILGIAILADGGNAMTGIAGIIGAGLCALELKQGIITKGIANIFK